MYYTYADTPAGTLLFIGDGKVISGIHWQVFKRAPLVAGDWIENRAIFNDALKELDEYFAGTRKIFTFTYAFKGTDFQKAVWKELEKIPYGTYSSYHKLLPLLWEAQRQ